MAQQSGLHMSGGYDTSEVDSRDELHNTPGGAGFAAHKWCCLQSSYRPLELRRNEARHTMLDVCTPCTSMLVSKAAPPFARLPLQSSSAARYEGMHAGATVAVCNSAAMLVQLWSASARKIYTA